MGSTNLCVVAMTAMGMLAPEQGTSSKEETKRAEVLVLGTYHMANPGHDIFNVQADDVLSPNRQQEIAELAAVLKKFKPTKIAVEADYGQDVVPKRYADYLAGAHPLSRNEVEQIGFRLAKELGHTTIYPVDAEGDFPFQRIVNYARASGQSAKLEGLMGEIGEMVKAQGEYLKAHTVLETLLYMNSDARVAKDVGFYYLFARYGEPGDYAGPDLLAEWYRRNVRIYNNVCKLVATPEDRILVIFGSGHLGWLRQNFAANPTLRVRNLEDFAPAATGGAERRPPSPSGGRSHPALAVDSQSFMILMAVPSSSPKSTRVAQMRKEYDFSKGRRNPYATSALVVRPPDLNRSVGPPWEVAWCRCPLSFRTL